MGGYRNGATASRQVFKICDADGRLYGRRLRIGDGEDKVVRWLDHEGDSPNKEAPLYGSERASGWDPEEPVLVVEGEKVTDALDGPVFAALGTLGTSHDPPEENLELLRDRTVVLCPDNDEPGRAHMRKIAEKVHRYAAEVLWYECPDVPEKGDLADHPAVRTQNKDGLDRLLNDLLSARRWEPTQPKGLEGRVRLGELIRGGIEPTPQLIEGLLYEGKIHSMASEPGTGKTLLAEWMSLEVMRKGAKVLYLDAENGPRLIAERLKELGADLDTIDDLFHYYPAEITLEAENLRQLAATVEEVEPALVVFDSLADFLALSGLEENSNSDCTRWVSKVIQPLKDAGVASLILDHVPKGSKGPRGASSKLAKVDVQWNLEVSIVFDRERTGEIELKHTKDRECWLPKIARFSVGGGVFARSAGTIEEPDPQTRMSGSASTIYDALKKAGAEGARWKELEDAAGGSKGTVTRGLKELERYQLSHRRNGRYYLTEAVPANPIGTPNTEGTTRYQKGTTVPSGTGESGKVPRGTTPLRVGTTVPDAEPDELSDYDAKIARVGRRLAEDL